MRDPSPAKSPLGEIVPAGAGGHSCAFVGQNGQPCPEEAATPGGLCFWHDPAHSKTDPNLKPRLEALARSGRSLEGFNLRGANLRGMDLTHPEPGQGVNLSHADLSRSNLEGAHLFRSDLRGASLLKSNLRGANLNDSRLEGANLLGADFRDARLERIDWGRHLMQERGAARHYHEGRALEALRLWGEAEETYRAVSLAMQQRGHPNLAGSFYQKQMTMQRMQLPRWSREWLWSKLVDVICGYGERADRVIGFSLSVILACALAYFFGAGLLSAKGQLGFDPRVGFGENFLTLLTCVYFSVVTFTTVGYGDIAPTGWLRALAAMEAFVGAFSISLFVVVFVKRLTR